MNQRLFDSGSPKQISSGFTVPNKKLEFTESYVESGRPAKNKYTLLSGDVFKNHFACFRIDQDCVSTG